MRVSSNQEIGGLTGIPSQPQTSVPRLGQDRIALEGSSRLDQAFAQTPEVRQEAVTRAQALIQDESYPPDAIIRKISALLAIEMDRTQLGG